MKQKKIVLVDFSNFCYAVYYAGIFVLNKRWDGEIQPTKEMLYRLARGKIQKLKNRIKKHDEFYFVLDSGRGDKMELLDDYKGNRIKLPMNPILILGKKLVKDYNFVYSPNEEADDCIATICQGKHKYTIVTTDQDMWQLINKNVKILHTNKLEYATKEKLYDKYGIKKWPNIVDYKVIFGDNSDNIDPLVKRLRRQPIIDKLNKGQDCISICKELKQSYDVKIKDVKKRIKAIQLRTELDVISVEANQIAKVIKRKL